MFWPKSVCELNAIIQWRIILEWLRHYTGMIPELNVIDQENKMLSARMIDFISQTLSILVVNERYSLSF